MTRAGWSCRRRVARLPVGAAAVFVGLVGVTSALADGPFVAGHATLVDISEASAGLYTLGDDGLVVRWDDVPSATGDEANHHVVRAVRQVPGGRAVLSGARVLVVADDRLRVLAPETLRVEGDTEIVAASYCGGVDHAWITEPDGRLVLLSGERTGHPQRRVVPGVDARGRSTGRCAASDAGVCVTFPVGDETSAERHEAFCVTSAGQPLDGSVAERAPWVRAHVEEDRVVFRTLGPDGAWYSSGMPAARPETDGRRATTPLGCALAGSGQGSRQGCYARLDRARRVAGPPVAPAWLGVLPLPDALVAFHTSGWSRLSADGASLVTEPVWSDGSAGRIRGAFVTAGEARFVVCEPGSPGASWSVLDMGGRRVGTPLRTERCDGVVEQSGSDVHLQLPGATARWSEGSWVELSVAQTLPRPRDGVRAELTRGFAPHCPEGAWSLEWARADGQGRVPLAEPWCGRSAHLRTLLGPGGRHLGVVLIRESARGDLIMTGWSGRGVVIAQTLLPSAWDVPWEVASDGDSVWASDGSRSVRARGAGAADVEEARVVTVGGALGRITRGSVNLTAGDESIALLLTERDAVVGSAATEGLRGRALVRSGQAWRLATGHPLPEWRRLVALLERSDGDVRRDP